jgi:fluoride exporter
VSPESFASLGAVAVGGAVGACFRALVYHAAARLQHANDWLDQPRGTWLVNALGSLVLGWVVAGGLDADPSTELASLDLVSGVGAGFCGSFTTFSTFIGDCYLLIREERLRDLAWHLGLNGGLGLAAAAIGLRLGGASF